MLRNWPFVRNRTWSSYFQRPQRHAVLLCSMLAGLMLASMVFCSFHCIQAVSGYAHACCPHKDPTKKVCSVTDATSETAKESSIGPNQFVYSVLINRAANQLSGFVPLSSLLFPTVVRPPDAMTRQRMSVLRV